MEDIDYNDSLADSDDLASVSGVEGDLQPFQLEELREIEKKEVGVCFISEDLTRRCQSYEVPLGGLDKCIFVRQEGFDLDIPQNKFFFMRCTDENGKYVTLAVSPQMIWEKSGYWLTSELVDWAKDNELQIIHIILYAIREVFDFFDLSYVEMITKTKFSTMSRDICYMLNEDKTSDLIIEAEKDTLDEIEYRLRHYSVKYHKNCLWLGSKVSFKLDCFISAFKPIFDPEEIASLQVGDLIRLKHKESDKDSISLSAKVACQGMKSNTWWQKIYLRITNEDLKMEFEDDEWQLEDAGHDSDDYGDVASDDFKFGEQGPDAIHLDLHIGTTTLSFNELCNIQEGSLIELKGNILPMVQLKIANEMILEGELVRLNDQLMVQVIRKVE